MRFLTRGDGNFNIKYNYLSIKLFQSLILNEVKV